MEMDLDSGQDLGEGQLRRLVDHVFLPRKLPAAEAESLVEDESNILAILTSVVNTSEYVSVIPKSTRNLFTTWNKNQRAQNPLSISNSLRTLGKGDMFGYYVPAQNAGILIHVDYKSAANELPVTMSTFPASLKSDVVMSNRKGEIISAYPEQSIKIPKSDLLCSEAVARQIVTLTNEVMLDAMKTSRKGGSDHVEVREVPNTTYISGWLTCLLSNANSRTATDAEFPRICKKVRDNVVWKNSIVPFRRSGMWMTAKVILQLNLAKSAPANFGIFLYKLILAEFMRQICELAVGASLLDPDVGMYMIKKLARRVKKIQAIEIQYPNLTAILLSKTSETCKRFKEEMANLWHEEMPNVKLPQLQIEKLDIVHKNLPKIPCLSELIKQTPKTNTVPTPTCSARVQLSSNRIPNIKSLLPKEEDRWYRETLGNVLFETESWIFEYLDLSVEHNHASSTGILAMADSYVRAAVDYYDSNPVGMSRMVLAFLKVVQVLDQIAVRCYPLLKEHRVGVNPIIIHQLLLRLKSELELAHELELYFQERDKNAKFPGLTEEDAITINSFSVRYGNRDGEMCKLRNKILLDAEHKILRKFGELKNARKVCAGLRQEINNTRCTCGHMLKSNTCGYHTTQKLLNVQSVTLYERPLRPETHNQIAAVFELLIPPEIACLRDAVILLLSKVCKAKTKPYRIEGRIWTDYKKLSKYGNQMAIQKYFKLGSTIKLFRDSHYKESHPDNADLAFIVNNGYNCTFAGNYEKIWKVKRICTLKVSPNSLYSDLQWTLETTQHTQNQVLASQVKCPEKLRLVEYKEFGSLRAGHRLQLHNILRSMVERSLSFKEESVFSLICQAVWEAGPEVIGTWHRESHDGLANVSFAEEWVQEVGGHLAAHQDNWDEPFTLLSIIVLAERALEFGQVSPAAVELLFKCRSTAYDWIRRIEEMITNSYDSPLDWVQNLTQKLVDACICVCLSYAVGAEYIDLVLKSDNDFFFWMHALARIYSNVTSSEPQLSYTKNMLIELVRNVGLNIEPKLAIFVNSGMKKFVEQNWNEGVHGILDDWQPYPAPAGHIYHTHFHREGSRSSVHLQVDLLRGSFLINGLPVGYLPENIIKHSTFSRIFQEIVFEVHPALEEKTLVTTHLYRNADYRFTLVGETEVEEGILIIRERQKNVEEDEFQLIPHTLFSNLIPYLLVQDYSHWLNLKKNYIEFRPVEFSKFGKEKPKFRLHLGTKELTEMSTENLFFCVTSSTHTSLTKYLGRLEDSQYIHTTLDPDGRVKVQLPRMRLSFEFDDETSHLKSLEYGMQVCPNQSFGTLIGLENGLLLENQYNERALLVPHGLATVPSSTLNPLGKNKSYHHRVQINMDNLRQPSVFIFDVDDQLQQLRARKSTTGWLYLAYLHALTASPLEDPLTGLTGTESAFKILQSGVCWSCKPYENQESLDILQEIRSLAPRRLFYPRHLNRMETVTWPRNLPSSAAQDGFRFIVDKLVEDSMRLGGLFHNNKLHDDIFFEEYSTEEDNSVVLSERAYIRYEPLCSKEGKISEQFLNLVTPVHHKLADSLSWTTAAEKVTNTRTISELGHSWAFKQPSGISLTGFLIRDAELKGLTDPIEFTRMSMMQLMALDFRDNWINIYELGRLVKKQNFKSEWTTILSILAFCGLADINHLLLQAVAVQRIFFQTQNPPTTTQMYMKPNNFFNLANVTDCFRTRIVDQVRLNTLTSLVKVLWPIKSCDLSTFDDFVGVVMREDDLVRAIDKLNQHFVQWNQNAELRDFLQKIETTMADLPTSSCRHPAQFLPQSNKNLTNSFAKKEKFRLEFDGMVKSMEDMKSIEFQKLATPIFKTGFLEFPSTPAESELENGALLEHFRKQSEFYRNKRVKIFGNIKELLIYPETEGLFHSDLFRVTPTSLLTCLLSGDKINPGLRNLIGAYGVLWTLEQRANRCIRYYLMGGRGVDPLMRERKKSNRGHLNWSPSEFPEWLLFEIESNLMIRSVQVKVARQMISPPDGKHSVMQLNMGEGKTAVIVPLLALTLANGTQVFRVTVLKSLFKTNMASLIFCLRGLLNRRIYTFPCQRDLQIGGKTAKKMLSLYQECKSNRGVVITLPEHRLSFQLKGYEKARAGQIEAAKPLTEVRNWLNMNVRDVLDESDEILHAKYQLIYTLGSQLPVDGGALRWLVAQSLIKLIPARMIDLQNKFGDSFVDISTTNVERTEMFHHTRILKRECYQQLIEWLAADILDMKSPGIKVPELNQGNRELIMDLMTNTKIDKDRHDQALSLLVSTHQISILTLMGYLKYEILYLVLSKRWRVSYGVDTEGERKMAVPFRAKDVPSKRTEFGHPDVAIMLTQLSYYYSGLSDDELDECFTALNSVSSKEEEYASWIRQIPANFVNPSIKIFSGVNLADLKQKNVHLFPVLRKNMTVVDFYLAQIVFPKESRVFEKKLVCTSWDLCSEDFLRPLNGFSGTNDSSNLLPAPVSQQDLPQLQNTNDEMRKTILKEENNHVDILPRGITAVEILKRLIKKNIPVLLDSGALMLELDNEGVARKWLELLQEDGQSGKEAAVYYDDDNELRVKAQSYLEDSVPFHTSSYVDKLDQCVIYLDDVHTRGTDLKIPPPSKACVTLCAGITRDKMVQACMRMRLLGKGHTIHFFANDEAGEAMTSARKKQTPNFGISQVMEWVCGNSTQFEKDGLVYWAASGINYDHKRVVESVFNKTQKSAGDYVYLGESCCDQEFQTLEVMYGCHRHALLYMDVLRSQIDRKKDEIKEQLEVYLLDDLLQDCKIFKTFATNVMDRCQEYIPNKIVVSHLLDEEQEKEHEEEPEQEVEISRPPAAVPAQHKLSEHVVHFITSGDVAPGLTSHTIYSLHAGFRLTTMWTIKQGKSWCNEQVYVTRDFVSVIISDNPQDKLNEFLRTPNWVATFCNAKKPSMTILLMSPYEANALIPTIKGSTHGVHLRMFAPRLIPKQPILIDSHKLVFPYPNNFRSLPPTIPMNLLPPLFLFSGTLYFVNSQEQKQYCYFTGILPYNTRTKKEKLAVIQGKTDRGFLLQQHRKETSSSINQFCSFTQHPERMIREVIETRHGHFPQMSHVSKLIIDCREVTDFDK